MWPPFRPLLDRAPALAVDRVPVLAAAATALVGAINLGSAMTQDLPARLQALLALAPQGEIRLAHTLALPVGIALLGAAWPLARRRRRAFHAAFGLLMALGFLNLLKGLDVEEAAVSWGLAAILWRARAAFWVRHDPDGLARALCRGALALGAAALAGMALVALAAPHATTALSRGKVPGAAAHLLVLDPTVAFTAPFGWLPRLVGLLGFAALATAAAGVLAPLRPRRVAAAVDRRRAAALVRRHGSDTLSAFKLRRDLPRHWSSDGRAMAAYRVEAGTVLLAGDPVGAPDAVAGLLHELLAGARRHGLTFGCVGASEAFAAQARAAGVRSLYLGDEAILPTGGMDLAGGAMKSLRKAVNRVSRNGVTAELSAVGDLDGATLAALHRVSDAWRGQEPERGFSMAHDALHDELLPDALVVLARDADREVRGFLHFVPVFGRPAVSLGFMRRERDTPNGLMDFLVVEAARLLGERGIEEFSLNFASYGRWLRAPSNHVERALATVLRRADRLFQIERLLRFNAKFQPRWQPRYLLFESTAALPRVALAAMWAEGQLPRPAPRRRCAPGEALALASP
jgi:lysyl-tRNA synthetase class 2